MDKHTSARDEASATSSGDALQRQLEAARNGDAAAMGQVLDACRGYLLAMANRQLDVSLRPKMGASDIVQETLLAAQRNLPQFRGHSEAELMGWLRGILTNQLAGARRAWQQTEKREIDRERNLDGDSQIGRQPIQLCDGIPTPGTNAVGREQAEVLKRAIQQLPEDMRKAVLMRNWERLSFEEIGRRLNRSSEAARKLWSRSVERLRELMRSDDDK